MPAVVNYRKIWESINGPIPKDEFGISYDIHHINGDRTDNRIENLMAVSVHEHYNIHYKQKDYAACILIGKRIGIVTDTKGEKNFFFGKKHTKESMIQMVESRLKSGNGNYHLPGKNPFLSKEVIEKTKKRMLTNNPMHNDVVKYNMKTRKVKEMGFDNIEECLNFLEKELNAGKSLTRISLELQRDKGFLIDLWRNKMEYTRKEPKHA